MDGGGGTTDYRDLSNKPKINNVELVGNKTAADLGLDGTTDYTDLENKPKINNVELKGNKSLDDLGITYSALSSKPKINNVELSGNKTSSQLGLASASDIVDEVVIGQESQTDEHTKLLVEDDEVSQGNYPIDSIPLDAIIEYAGNTVPEGYEQVADDTTYFTWTPTLSCQTVSEAPTVTYSYQKGYGCKIKISDEYSLVCVGLFLRGNITAVSSGNNYATIAGLPYDPMISNVFTLSFNDFYRGVTLANALPTGYFANRTIRVQNGTARGSSVEHWVTCENFEICGSGFYFTSN